MGWFWFIPTFHMPHPIPSSASEKTAPTHFKLSRKEVDFPLGIGSHLVDVDIEMEWIARGESNNAPVTEFTAASLDPEEDDMGEQKNAGLSRAIAALQVVAEGGDIPEAIDTTEAIVQ